MRRNSELATDEPGCTRMEPSRKTGTVGERTISRNLSFLFGSALTRVHPRLVVFRLQPIPPRTGNGPDRSAPNALLTDRLTARDNAPCLDSKQAARAARRCLARSASR